MLSETLRHFAGLLLGMAGGASYTAIALSGISTSYPIFYIAVSGIIMIALSALTVLEEKKHFWSGIIILFFSIFGFVFGGFGAFFYYGSIGLSMLGCVLGVIGAWFLLTDVSKEDKDEKQAENVAPEV